MFKNLSPGAVGIGGAFPEIMQLASKAGFEGIDVPIAMAADKVEQGAADEVKAVFAEAGLQMGGWGLPVDFRKDEETFRQGLARLPRLAKAGQAVGAFRVPTWILPFSDELTYEQNFKQHARRLGACAEILSDHGCRLGLEFVGPKTSRAPHKYEFAHNMHQMLELVDEIDVSGVGLLLDAWHWYTAHHTAEDLAQLTNELVVYVHVNDAPSGIDVDEQVDNVRDLPGATGVIDIGTFLRALDAMGYDGPITPEPFSQELREMPNDEAAARTVQSLNAIFATAGVS